MPPHPIVRLERLALDDSDGGQLASELLTCEACAVTLRDRLAKMPGVARTEVSFEKKTARVFFAEGQPRPSNEDLLSAIRKAGYSGTSVEPPGAAVNPW